MPNKDKQAKVKARRPPSSRAAKAKAKAKAKQNAAVEGATNRQPKEPRSKSGMVESNGIDPWSW